MLQCTHCSKTYKTVRGRQNHIDKVHYYYHDRKFNCFTRLPAELHYEIFKFLDYKDLLNVYRAGVNKVFYHQNNFQWAAEFEKIKKTLKRQMHFRSYGITLLKYHNNLCFYCLISCGKQQYNPFYLIPICKNCQRQHLPMITKTTAKTKFKLKDRDLAQLDCISVKNPHFSTAANMVLYLQQDVQAKTE